MVFPEVLPTAKTCYFIAIPADKRIAPAEELCVKGHSCTHIYLLAQDCSWQKPQQVAFRVWRTDWVNPGKRDCKLRSDIITEWCPRDMLYDNRFSEERRSRELELLQNTLSEVDASYSWKQVKKLLQDSVFPWCEKFGTWSSSRVRVDRVPNRKVSKQKKESSVLGPQNVRESRSSPE